MQAMLLARLISLVETGAVQAPLFDPNTISDPNMSNQTYLKQYLADLLANAFQHVQPSVPPWANNYITANILCRAQISAFVSLMFDHSSDPVKFRFTLRDFLISLKEFSDDNAELYIEEKEAESKEKERNERELAMRVPGMLKPAQLDDDTDL